MPAINVNSRHFVCSVKIAMAVIAAPTARIVREQLNAVTLLTAAIAMIAPTQFNAATAQAVPTWCSAAIALIVHTVLDVLDSTKKNFKSLINPILDKNTLKRLKP